MERRQNGTFKKGIAPWNKNTKGVMKSNKTSFKEGEKPPKHKKGCKCFRCDTNFVVSDGEKIRRKESAKKMGLSRKGIKPSEETREKISKGIKKNLPKTAFKNGEEPWNYIDGRSKTLGPARYGDDWNKIRMQVYNRDNFTCQECGITMTETKRAHHIHHIVPFLQSFDNSLNNLITLCPSCHRIIEVKIMRELKNMDMEV